MSTDMAAVQHPSLASIPPEKGQDNSSADFELRKEANVMVINHLCAQPP